MSEFPHDIQFTLLNANRIRLQVAQAGPAAGPLAILLQGFPEYQDSWAEINR